MELRLTIPPAPSVNAMYLTTKFGKRVRTKKAKEWFEEAEAITRKAIKEQGWKRTEKQKVVVNVLTLWGDNRRRDTNNLSKSLADMLEHAGVYDDDCYALIRYIDFGVDKANPRVEMVIRPFTKNDMWKEGDCG